MIGFNIIYSLGRRRGKIVFQLQIADVKANNGRGQRGQFLFLQNTFYAFLNPTQLKRFARIRVNLVFRSFTVRRRIVLNNEKLGFFPERVEKHAEEQNENIKWENERSLVREKKYFLAMDNEL